MGNETKELAKALEDLRRELRADLRSLKESVKFCNDTCDGVKAINDEMKELRKEILDLTKRNQELDAENFRLGARVEELEQYQRSNSLEIKGVPSQGDVTDVVKRIGALLDEPVADADIDICHRVATFIPDQKNIIVRFVQRSKRNKILEKAKKKRITTASLEFGGAASPVYVNEHLTGLNKKLLGTAIAQKRRVGWRFVWCSGGKIFARKNETSDVLKITCLSDVEKIRN